MTQKNAHLYTEQDCVDGKFWKLLLFKGQRSQEFLQPSEMASPLRLKCKAVSRLLAGGASQNIYSNPHGVGKTGGSVSPSALEVCDLELGSAVPAGEQMWGLLFFTLCSRVARSCLSFQGL